MNRILVVDYGSVKNLCLHPLKRCSVFYGGITRWPSAAKTPPPTNISGAECCAAPARINRNAFCGIWTWPTWFIRVLRFFDAKETGWPVGTTK